MKFTLLIFCSILLCQEQTYIDSSNVSNPEVAWKFSLVPGIGQLYNKKYIKSVLFIASESVVIHRYMNYKNNNKIKLRNTYGWWIFGIYIWGMLDAYVDAHLSTFPIQHINSTVERDSLGTINK